MLSSRAPRAPAAIRCNAIVPLTEQSRFDAASVVALKMRNDARLIEIRFVDAQGVEHVVSLPIPAGVELAGFISAACSFMTRLGQPAH